MIGKAVIVILTLGAAATCVLWIAQLRGPIQFTSGPKFRDVKWGIYADMSGGPSWGMDEPSGSKEVFSATVGVGLPFGFSAVEIPATEAPPLWDNTPLIGVGFGYLHLGLASFGTVPSPKTPPAPGMVYVTSQHIGVSVPFWALLLGTLAYPTFALVRGPLRRHRRRKRGSCVACAYNLTGNESGVCPECGKAVT